MSEISMQIFGRIIIALSCFFSGREIAKSNRLTIDDDAGAPTASIVPAYALIATLVVRMLGTVSRVLRMITGAKVAPLVVQAISVPVINLRFTRANSVVHVDPFRAFFSDGIKGVSFPLGAPVPLGKPLEIPDINNGVLALRKWDKSVRLINWLSNRVPFNPAFWHESSSKGLMCSAILTWE